MWHMSYVQYSDCYTHTHPYHHSSPHIVSIHSVKLCLGLWCGLTKAANAEDTTVSLALLLEWLCREMGKVKWEGFALEGTQPLLWVFRKAWLCPVTGVVWWHWFVFTVGPLLVLPVYSSRTRKASSHVLCLCDHRKRQPLDVMSTTACSHSVLCLSL